MQNPVYEECIAACNSCAAACDHCASACLDEADVDKMVDCIRLDMDCAQICRLAAAYMARDSEFAQPLCQFCAEICAACADECARHEAMHCQACAQACRACAEQCRRMDGEQL